ncbi:unnamed protein product [Caenorhabditis bovis]|uniref:Tubulin--tyrosine ligase-like protein 5 n=1 Tax=Caenorhabditis bovis TaxID=2654633 RepID=A0A8S1E308_9PELO|nr:unnamed protein product [Caenorhabditis bovis]
MLEQFKTVLPNIEVLQGLDKECTIEIPVPLLPNTDINDYVGAVRSTETGKFVSIDDTREQLKKFIVNRTEQYEDQESESILQDFFSHRNRYLPDGIRGSSPKCLSKSRTFAEKFTYVVSKCSSQNLLTLMQMECCMKKQMSEMIRARNWEVQQVSSRCEKIMCEDLEDIHPHKVSMLNEKLRQIYRTYSLQVSELCESQRIKYRKAVESLCYHGSLPAELVDEIDINDVSIPGENEEENIEGINESFTIYIGAQLKSMHNACLVTVNNITDLCKTSENDWTISTRLEMATKLYGRNLGAVILLVPPDPMHHVNSSSKFYNICEQSTELHFEPLADQLNQIAQSIRKANEWRVECSESAGAEKPIRADSTFSVGDVYCTKHSNLHKIQIAFHLVVDESLQTQEISSRHPCLNGIRNIIRMTSHYGITSIHLPLFLIEKPDESTTVAWCIKRAEMVYKCVKGYLMEVCSGTNLDCLPHYNVHFVLPSGLSPSIYASISNIKFKLHPDNYLEEYFTELEIIDLKMSPNKDSGLENKLGDGDNAENGQCIVQRRRKYKSSDYMLFTADALQHISDDSKSLDKYTWLGERLRLSFKMNRSNSKLVRTMLHSHGFLQCSSKNPMATVIWSGAPVKTPKMRELLPWQRLNQFPRTTELTKKDRLYENIARAQSIFGEAFDFIPEFYVTPREMGKMKEAFDKLHRDVNEKRAKYNYPGEFIVKPTNSRQGKGIFFANKIEDIPTEYPLLVSRYLADPLLVNKHKFDLRIYVAVTSFYPLVCYVYSEGLARLASMPYDSSISSTESNEYIHLTNYSINKNSTSFVRNESMSSEDLGHKWTLGALLRYVECEGHDAKLLMIRIEDIIVKSLLSIQNSVATASKTALRFVGTNFELFGFDILVDNSLKPWLLEVNLSPSLACDAPLDSLIKTRLVADLLNLACIPLIERRIIDSLTPTLRMSNENDDAEPLEMDPKCVKTIKRRPLGIKRSVLNRRYASGSSLLITPAEQKMDQIIRKAKAENERRGDFVRVFPRTNTWDLYSPLMEDLGTDDYDQRLYEEIIDNDNKDEISEELSEDFHDVMMQCAVYPTFESIPENIRKIISSWYVDAGEYTKKITQEGEIYASKLPTVRPSARLRTKSCAEFYEERRVEMLKKREADQVLAKQFKIPLVVKALSIYLLKYVHINTA